MRLSGALGAILFTLAFAAAAHAAKTSLVAIPIQGMTCRDCATQVQQTLAVVRGVQEVKPSIPEKVVRVRFDPDRTSVKALVREINGSTAFHANMPKPPAKAPARRKGA
jgi:copper chaperone CopZ